jgi:DNA-binding CsgD family transcriptional regulator
VPPRELPISDDAAQALLGDRELGALWEQLRRTKRPLTAQEIAERSGLEPATVQRHLDRMEGLGLAERLPRSSRRPLTCYRVTASDVVIRYRVPQDHGLVAEALASHSTHVQRTIETNGHGASDDGHASWLGCYAAVVALTESEAAELGRRLEAVVNYLHQLRLRPPARNEVAPLANHSVTIRSGPLEPRVLPLPTVRFVAVGAPVPHAAGRGPAMGARPHLSAREHQVGAAYARGLTRAQVAAELGLSENSVATFTKRLYKKLGIRRRGTLVTRLAEVLGNPPPHEFRRIATAVGSRSDPRSPPLGAHRPRDDPSRRRPCPRGMRAAREFGGAAERRGDAGPRAYGAGAAHLRAPRHRLEVCLDLRRRPRHHPRRVRCTHAPHRPAGERHGPRRRQPVRRAGGAACR